MVHESLPFAVNQSETQTAVAPSVNPSLFDSEASLQPVMIRSGPIDHTQHDFRMLVEAVSVYAVYMLTTDGFVSSWNKGAERNKGYTADEAIGLHFSIFYTPEERLAGIPWKALQQAERSKFEAYGWRVRKDGSRFWARVVIEAIRSPAGVLVGFAKVTCDITAQKIERDTLMRNLDMALSNMSQGLCLFDANEKLVLSNARFCELYNLPVGAIKPGTPFRDLVGAMLATRHHGEKLVELTSKWHKRALKIIAQPGGGGTVVKLDDDCILSIIYRPLADGSWVSTLEDITERSRSQQQVAHMALHDSLTDLPNRIMFRQRLDDALDRVKRGEICAVFCLDLDRFKTVNDTLGHPVGDELLISIAAKLRNLARDTDTVARLGGDEFAIIQTQLSQPSDATAFANRVVSALSEPEDIMGHLIASGVSIGIALAPNDGTDPDQLLKNADLALYRAKSEGRGRYCYFEPEMDTLLQQRRLLELDLRTALTAREFELYYQPIVNIERNEVSGFEALLRWHSPRRGMVSPLDFIPLAEEIGLIVDIGAWVLETACMEAMQWPGNIKLAVNVSVAQFKGFGLVAAVKSALSKSGLPPERLEIEITESIMINDSQHACEVLHLLKNIGLSVSMDDFGTGYSSLGYLRSFPFDKIKIDRSFIQGMEEGADCKAIVQAVLGICNSLGIVATAEGVETREQMDMLRFRNCHQAQGYLISRPSRASGIASMLASFEGDNVDFKQEGVSQPLAGRAS